MKPKNPSKCRLQVYLYPQNERKSDRSEAFRGKTCIRSRYHLKNYCAEHNLNLDLFDHIKFFHNPAALLNPSDFKENKKTFNESLSKRFRLKMNEKSTNNSESAIFNDFKEYNEKHVKKAKKLKITYAEPQDIIEDNFEKPEPEKDPEEDDPVLFFGFWEPFPLDYQKFLEQEKENEKMVKSEFIYTNSIKKLKTSPKENPTMFIPSYVTLGKFDENCLKNRIYLTPREPGIAVTNTVAVLDKPKICDKPNTEILPIKIEHKEAIISIFAPTKGLNTVYGFAEHRLTGTYEHKASIFKCENSIFKGETPFDNFRYYV